MQLWSFVVNGTLLTKEGFGPLMFLGYDVWQSSLGSRLENLDFHCEMIFLSLGISAVVALLIGPRTVFPMFAMMS